MPAGVLPEENHHHGDHHHKKSDDKSQSAMQRIHNVVAPSSGKEGREHKDRMAGLQKNVKAEDHSNAITSKFRRGFHHFLEWETRKHAVHHRDSVHIYGKFSKHPTEMQSKSRGQDHVIPDRSSEYVEGYQESWPIVSACFTLAQIGMYLIYGASEGLDVMEEGPFGDHSLWFSHWWIKCRDNPVGLAIGCPYVFEDLRGELWRYFSYGLVHVNFGHLFGNLLVELFFAVPLEIVHGPRAILELIFVGLLAGSATHGAASSTQFVVGSSGYAWALAGMHTSNLVLNWKEIGNDDAVQLFPGLKNNYTKLMYVVCFLGMQLGPMIAADQDISHAAHLGGLSVGFLLGLKFLKNIVERGYEHYYSVGGLIIGTIFLFTVLFIDLLPSEPSGCSIKTCCGKASLLQETCPAWAAQS